VGGRGHLLSEPGGGTPGLNESDFTLARVDGAGRIGTPGTWVRTFESSFPEEWAPASDGDVFVRGGWWQGGILSRYLAKLNSTTGLPRWSASSLADSIATGPDTLVLLGQVPVGEDEIGRPPAPRTLDVVRSDLAAFDHEARLEFVIRKPDGLSYERAAITADGTVYIFGATLTDGRIPLAVDQDAGSVTGVSGKRVYFLSQFRP